MTEWHQRNGGPGVMIYRRVERRSTCIYSQLKNCSSSEVAAMIEGLLRHCTDAENDANPIRWELVAQQYDQMVKYATALRLGTAESESILRRFTRAATHPTYQAMLEVGRAQKTIFLCRYLRDRDLQREINSGLNLAESWNRANAEIFYGKARDIASNRRDEQEMSVLCLHILQAAMVYVNTLVLQDVLAEDEWSQLLTSEDDRGLTPLTWAHVAIYLDSETFRVTADSGA